MAIKSKELAGLLGVSAATVSLVLNNKPGISEELRNTLLERIREMGYGYMIREVSAEGVQTRFQGTNSICYVLLSEYPDEMTEASFFPTVIEGAEREARYQGYGFAIIHMYGEKGRYLKEYLGPGQYAGMIVYTKSLDEDMKKQLDETEIPYIVMDCCDPLMRVSSVTVNNRQGVEAAIRYLYGKGHRRIGYVSSGRGYGSLAERGRCFRYAMEEMGLSVGPDQFIDTGKIGEGAQKYLEKFWKSEQVPPTALLVENDVLAVSVYRALKRAGYRIPEDVSVMGFEGRSICTLLEPTLTTMRVPRRLLGRALMMLLRNKMDLASRSLEDVPVRVEVNAELVEMESVAQVRQEISE